MTDAELMTVGLAIGDDANAVWVLSRWFAFMRDVEEKLTKIVETSERTAKACEK